MGDLTKYEEIVLIMVLALKDNAYGVDINERIAVTTGKEWNYGTLYRMLDQLVRKGLLERRSGEAGRRKHCYAVTAEGFEWLEESRQLQTALWNEKTVLAIDRGRRS